MNLTFDKKKWLFSVPLTVGLGFGVASLTEYIQTFVRLTIIYTTV